MKFGKQLKQQIRDTLPYWRDNFLSYKELKQLISSASASASASTSLSASTLLNGKVEAEFVCLLDSEIDKFNVFFMEQEEDFIIRHRELGQRIQRVINTWGPNGSQPSEIDYIVEMGKIREDIVNLHGEMVLLLNYSNVNYTGLTKILKKYDKRTGGLLRLPFIQQILQQPFYTTDLISKIIKECENTIDAVFPVEEERREGEREAITMAGTGTGDGIFRNTVAALLSMQEIRRASSTYSHFSLPPLNLPDSELFQSFRLNSPIPIL